MTLKFRNSLSLRHYWFLIVLFPKVCLRPRQDSLEPFRCWRDDENCSCEVKLLKVVKDTHSALLTEWTAKDLSQAFPGNYPFPTIPIYPSPFVLLMCALAHVFDALPPHSNTWSCQKGIRMYIRTYVCMYVYVNPENVLSMGLSVIRQEITRSS